MVAHKNQEIIFVTGKGGVGKSAVAAAVAEKRAKEGKKVLLAELGYQSFYQDYFAEELGGQPIVYKPRKKGAYDIALWSGPECLKEYALHLLKIESLYKLFFENAVTKALVNVAPALPELAMLGKITSGHRQVGPPMDYDCIVVDAFATGHFLALLRAPVGMAEAVKFGPMGEQTRSIQKVITNSDYCKYLVVSFPEEMPVVEAEELASEIFKITRVRPVHVFNKIWPLESLSEEQVSPMELVPFQKQMLAQKSRQIEFRQRLAREFSILELPMIFQSNGPTVVKDIAERLSL